jgi:hypothetical protein
LHYISKTAKSTEYYETRFRIGVIQVHNSFSQSSHCRTARDFAAENRADPGVMRHLPNCVSSGLKRREIRADLDCSATEH